MANQIDGDAIRRTLTLPIPPAHAFTLFTQGFASWYPSAYTWSGDVLDTIAIEPGVGGRCFERGPHGFRCDWGRVLVWEAPQRLVLTWQVGFDRVPVPDPDKASEIEIRFEAEGSSRTRMTFEHRRFSRHGPEGGEYRSALDSAEGWDHILSRFVAAAGPDGDDQERGAAPQ